MFKVTLEDEFKKNPELKAEDIQDVQIWIKSQPHLPPVPDLTIVLFLQACRWDLDTTKNTIDLYYTCRTKYTDFFSDRDPLSEEIQDIAKAVQVAFLPLSDPEGNRILWTRIVDPDPTNYNFIALIKYMTMTMEVFQLENGTVPGLVVVCDTDNFTTSHFPRIPFKHAKNNMHYSQNASSILLKMIHYINANSFIHKVFKIFKPLFRSAVFDMTQLHSNLEPLFQVIPKEIVPQEYGGKAMSLAEMNELNLKKLEEYRQYFKDQQVIVVDEKKRIRKNAKS
ncbi:alpha-tocopherol transfer protein-like [Homalodisca vitripennis]|uniref:alpha-tocopherol transfer protein-like n=1 Tax=Homalodisca vitripennis TaxID=197043 RepID=UPI001EEB07AA|nr:alpha-tocopherol transfer protein-like [Homalodisca vitripennis]XP_046679518.1 alpha-tocopherol transfer protein-like [Homalodisca vitripennis]